MQLKDLPRSLRRHLDKDGGLSPRTIHGRISYRVHFRYWRRLNSQFSRCTHKKEVFIFAGIDEDGWPIFSSKKSSAMYSIPIENILSVETL